ncbi:hypothetical protein CFC21_081922 [Triticum aestivum]|uniref:Uncharacterized protein n=3 Tax=Triticum TaxID=4564 RepID=A0A9R1AW09_TRITD|nr:hypothetical protein CFC21_081922 [Triticum aestivum]VAI42280.1 unnamed protein product [Triticum turgidum subsp. durum]
MALQCYTPLLKPQLAQVSVNPCINTIQIPGYATALAMVAGTTFAWATFSVMILLSKLKNLNLLHGFVMLDVPQETSFF